MKNGLFAPRDRGANCADDIARVKAGIRERLGLPEQWVVTVAELACSEPDCPPVETVVGVLGPGSARHAKVHCPLSEVGEAQLDALSLAFQDVPIQHPVSNGSDKEAD